MGRMYPLDPKPDDMRAMGEAAVEFLIGFIHGLDDAPLSNVQGSIELARSLRASPPEEGGSFADVFEDFKAAAAAAYETCAPATCRTSPAVVCTRPRWRSSWPWA